MSEDRVNILLVDDQPKNLLALESILSDMELNIVSASSGTEALRHLLSRDFAVILLDVQMPDLDGFETADLIRQRDRSRDTPIIFVTALGRSETQMFRGYELGAVDYIFKPFHAEVLRSKVNVFVELFKKREELKRQAQELRMLSRRNELILSAAAEGIFGVNLDGITTFVNPAGAILIGRDPDEIRGTDIHTLVHPEFPNVLTCDQSRCRLYAVVHGEPTEDEIAETFFRADGTSFPAEFCAAPMRDEGGKILGSVITFRDVSERRAAALAAEAERRYREAEAQNRAKDNFLATLSHELRTPMTSILGWVQYLRSGHYEPEELNEALRTIETSARLQARLIDDMLDVSRMILGKFQIELKPTRIADIVDAALTTARPVAADLGIRLHAEVEDPELIVQVDGSRIQQVIGNLLSNAFKFTPSGKCVELRVARVDGRLRICVTDEGEGIEPSFLPYVFDRLRQADGSQKRSGLGLGLAIARHIIELHHGEIHAASEGLGRGARFTVELPIAAESPQPAFAGRGQVAALTPVASSASSSRSRS